MQAIQSAYKAEWKNTLRNNFGPKKKNDINKKFLYESRVSGRNYAPSHASAQA